MASPWVSDYKQPGVPERQQGVRVMVVNSKTGERQSHRETAIWVVPSLRNLYGATEDETDLEFLTREMDPKKIGFTHFEMEPVVMGQTRSDGGQKNVSVREKSHG